MIVVAVGVIALVIVLVHSVGAPAPRWLPNTLLGTAQALAAGTLVLIVWAAVTVLIHPDTCP